MQLRCLYKNCDSTTGNRNEKKVTLFKFPIEKELLLDWICACNNSYAFVNKSVSYLQTYGRVCSKHFDREDFLSGENIKKKQVLKKNIRIVPVKDPEVHQDYMVDNDGFIVKFKRNKQTSTDLLPLPLYDCPLQVDVDSVVTDNNKEEAENCAELDDPTVVTSGVSVEIAIKEEDIVWQANEDGSDYEEQGFGHSIFDTNQNFDGNHERDNCMDYAISQNEVAIQSKDQEDIENFQKAQKIVEEYYAKQSRSRERRARGRGRPPKNSRPVRVTRQSQVEIPAGKPIEKSNLSTPLRRMSRTSMKAIPKPKPKQPKETLAYSVSQVKNIVSPLTAVFIDHDIKCLRKENPHWHPFIKKLAVDVFRSNSKTYNILRKYASLPSMSVLKREIRKLPPSEAKLRAKPKPKKTKCKSFKKIKLNVNTKTKLMTLKSNNQINTDAKISIPTLDIQKPDIPRAQLSTMAIPRSEISRPNINISEVPRPEMNISDIPQPDLPRQNMSTHEIPRLELSRPEMPRLDMSRPEVPRPDLPRPDMNRSNIPRPEMIRPDMQRLDMTRTEIPRPDLHRPELLRPDLLRPDSMTRPEMLRHDMSRPEMHKHDLPNHSLANVSVPNTVILHSPNLSNAMPNHSVTNHNIHNQNLSNHMHNMNPNMPNHNLGNHTLPNPNLTNHSFSNLANHNLPHNLVHPNLSHLNLPNPNLAHLMPNPNLSHLNLHNTNMDFYH